MILCIYHSNCADGFGAAWCVRHFFKAEGTPIEFYSAKYGQEPPDVTDKTVIIVDFSYPRDVLMRMSSQAHSILILDHHKSAQEQLALLPNAGADYETFKALWPTLPCNVAAVFDMDRSGAGLAWDFFFPGLNRPPLINHIEDRDLWRFQLQGTREIMAAVFSHPMEFFVWDDLIGGRFSLLREGTAILRQHDKNVKALLEITQRRMVIAGFDVPAANIPFMFASDAGNIMAKGEPFSACYTDGPFGRKFSLRSTDAGEDVSVIAGLYGGGGHRNAAGFSVDFRHPLGPLDPDS